MSLTWTGAAVRIALPACSLAGKRAGFGRPSEISAIHPPLEKHGREDPGAPPAPPAPPGGGGRHPCFALDVLIGPDPPPHHRGARAGALRGRQREYFLEAL